MNILIVDDQAIHRELLGAILARCPGHETRSTDNGRDALVLLQERGHRFDAVFLDVNMPGMSGLEVLEQIQDSPLHRSMQVVMCTSRNDRPTITRAIELGARHYLVKPCTEIAVTQKLRQLAGDLGGQ